MKGSRAFKHIRELAPPLERHSRTLAQAAAISLDPTLRVSDSPADCWGSDLSRFAQMID
jgi:hypothetical protein